MSAYRILCGAFWAALTLIFGIGAFAEFNIGNTQGGVLCVVITIPAAWYDYRIWTFKTNRFWFFWYKDLRTSRAVAGNIRPRPGRGLQGVVPLG